MLNIFKKISFILLFFCNNVLASSQQTIDHYPFLKERFNISQYKRCNHLIEKCPLSGIFRDASCTKNVIKENAICSQLKELTEILDMPPTQFMAKQEGNFTLINLFFPADGQTTYYIISPKGEVINTQVDPRKLDPLLAAKFKNKNFLVLSEDEPQHLSNDKDGLESFLALLKINDSCLACPTIGLAKIKFVFTKEGFLKYIQLESFKAHD